MRAILALAALVAAIPCLGQTAAELLQKGIYAQGTEGNLDNAILIYRQVVNSAPSPRDIAAQAQYRLAQALLQKGNLTEASKEFERLARDYADYSWLVSSLTGQIERTRLQRRILIEQPGEKGAELQKAGFLVTLTPTTVVTPEFDQPISFTGKISQVQWMNPLTWLKVDTIGGTYSVELSSPTIMVASGKMTRVTFQPGMEVTVTGILAKDGAHTAQANTVSSGGNVIFDRATLPSVPAEVPLPPR